MSRPVLRALSKRLPARSTVVYSLNQNYSKLLTHFLGNYVLVSVLLYNPHWDNKPKPQSMTLD